MTFSGTLSSARLSQMLSTTPHRHHGESVYDKPGGSNYACALRDAAANGIAYGDRLQHFPMRTASSSSIPSLDMLGATGKSWPAAGGGSSGRSTERSASRDVTMFVLASAATSRVDM